MFQKPQPISFQDIFNFVPEVELILSASSQILL